MSGWNVLSEAVCDYACVEFVSDVSDGGSVEAVISELSNHHSR